MDVNHYYYYYYIIISIITIIIISIIIFIITIITIIILIVIISIISTRPFYNITKIRREIGAPGLKSRKRSFPPRSPVSGAQTRLTPRSNNYKRTERAFAIRPIDVAIVFEGAPPGATFFPPFHFLRPFPQFSLTFEKPTSLVARRRSTPDREVDSPVLAPLPSPPPPSTFSSSLLPPPRGF